MLQFSTVFGVACLVISASSNPAEERATGVCPVDLNGEQALKLISLVMAKADEMKRSVSICIRDRHDNLVAHIRMKDAALGTVDLSCQKARSSALFPAPSAAFKAFPGIELSNGIISNLRGGLPLWASAGVSAGSIGVSGGQTGEEDEQMAMVAVANVNGII